MKKYLAIAAAAVVALGFMPAAEAQNWWGSQYYSGNTYGGNNLGWNNQFNNYGQRNNINSQQTLLENRIARGLQTGRISAQEATQLRNRLSQIATTEMRLRQTGNRLTQRERFRLNNQLASLSNRISNELNQFELRRIGYFGNFGNYGYNYNNNFGNYWY